jgi:hypothetical protein
MAQQLFLSLGQQFRNDADGDDARPPSAWCASGWRRKASPRRTW